ncbi:Hpt domain-containing protein [Thalassotalea profundi]|uniref:HPt domain-containing protein n=1 Tax=Thalassotalea profundi TaxID=2036687 RepID=A0ABQ3IWQ0_9GAMM|nr:Hpt domain-containing protein [Thalassotalea profundi]GHE93280.1 hypothetical protein GCM10011501_23320 [Thalassotalea profundi]
MQKVMSIEESAQLDIELLQGYVDNLGVSVVRKMLELYTQQSTLYIEAITLSMSEQSQTNWQDSCHKMKGAAGSVGLLQVHKQVASLEKSTKDWLLKTGDIESLIELNNQAKAAFNKWLDLKPQ